MDQTALRYFLEISRSGSLSKASERLFVAVSALSRQISRLEEQMGTPLFERRPRGMVLTDAGRLLASHVKRRQIEEERVIEEIKDLSNRGAVVLRVAASRGLAPDFLPQVCAEFLKMYPRTRFHLDESMPSVATQRVRDGSHDVAACFNIAPERDVEIQYVQPAPVCAVMQRGHALASRDSISLSELGSWPIALLQEVGPLRHVLEVACSMEGLIFEPVFVADSHSALRGFVQNTDAIMLTSYLTVHGRLASLGLVAVPITNPELHQRTLQVQTQAGRKLPEAVEAFVALLIKTIKASPMG
ncbi:LysR family transcriptional regulator [Ottowia thiooxydans]|uniref:LysR family transcriptional regulator n=1 Tax=Ottowia thiooxydans TaxID=219182 RepID=UPI00049134E2|nr:LysR family transcriptional regulator [Ottowia thiooxydans]